METVLVVESEQRVSKVLQLVLSEGGFNVVAARSGSEALRLAGIAAPSLAVLAAEGGDTDWTGLMRGIRRSSGARIVVISGSRSLAARSILDAGADDYLAKPFHPDELLARLRAIGRRVPPPDRDVLQIDGARLDLQGMVVERDGTRLSLSRSQWLILERLAAHRDGLVRSAELLERLSLPDNADSRTRLRSSVARLRRKLGAKPGEAGPIRSVTGVGYVLMTRND